MKNGLLWTGALVALILDGLTKYVVSRNLDLGETIPLWSGVLHLTFVTNRGAAFSLFATEGSSILPWISILVSVGIALYGLLGPSLLRLEALGYGLLLGGAIGNGIDRVLTGEVVDFIDFRLIQFPVFNIADIAINLGVACLLWASFREKKLGDQPPKL